LADITVNDQPVGVLWTAPYCIDITRHVRPGINRIVVKVTNTWRNRLAYDAALPEKERTTWTLAGPPPNAPLEPAGLIGPVQLLTGTVLATEATP